MKNRVCMAIWIYILLKVCLNQVRHEVSNKQKETSDTPLSIYINDPRRAERFSNVRLSIYTQICPSDFEI